MTASRDKQDLVNKQALQSLRDEMRLRDSLDRPLWISVHSHHFFDTREGVWRELNAVASRLWKGSLQGRPIRVKVVLLAESKSLKEKHILLPSFDPLRQAIIRDWLGSYHRESERLAIYEDAGLDRKLVRKIDPALAGGVAEHLPDAPTVLRPPKAEWDAAQFVEARNGQGQSREDLESRELKSSVVWRARLALQSAARALAETEIDQSKQELRLALMFSRLSRLAATAQDFDMHKEVLRQMRDRAFTIIVFHPMVVVDADIWGVSLEHMTAVRHARVHLTGVSRYPYNWFDIVHRSAVDEVVSKAQEDYDKQATESGLVPDEPEMGIVDYEIVDA